MAIEFEHSIDVARPPANVFNLLDDLAATPKWLARCTGIEKLTPGENRVGSKLRYSYKDGGRSGTMDGEITTRTVNERLTFQYGDKMMEVTVDFRMAPSGSGTKLTHAITIVPKSFMVKLFSFVIRRALPKNTIAAMEKLKSLVEGA